MWGYGASAKYLHLKKAGEEIDKEIFWCPLPLPCKKKLIYFTSFMCTGAFFYFLIYNNGLCFQILEQSVTTKTTFKISETRQTGENNSITISELNSSNSNSNLRITTTTGIPFPVRLPPMASQVIPVPVPVQGNNFVYLNLKLTEDKVGCNLPVLNPFDPSITEFVIKPDEIQCENAEHPLIFKTDLNFNLIVAKSQSEFGFVDCCYKILNRKEEDDNGYEFSTECIPIVQNITQILDWHEFIGVFCKNSTNSDDITTSNPADEANVNAQKTNGTDYKIVDIFGFVPIKIQVENRIKSTKSNEGPLSVVILGLDAISHMNFIRTMPETHKYLTKELSGIGMKGYVKVGDNTFPNLVPVLTGLNISQLEATCWNNSETEFDNCPFIWKKYAESGYRTSYGEDAPWLNVFNYGKMGFKNHPTDYYLRPFLYAQEEEIGHLKPQNMNLCYGPRLAINVLLDNIQKMATTMASSGIRNYFQFIWSNVMSHDDLNLPMLADDLVLSTLTFMKNNGFLNHTILLLMSDHGIRWGDIRDTHQGRIEERMPFVYFAFPDWFSQKYSSAVDNLKINGYRLTSPFDLHETLNDLISPENSLSDEEIIIRHYEMQQKPIPRGVSLFLPIPLSRTCADAEISDHWCVCNRMTPISVNTTKARKAAHSILSTINAMLINYKNCSKLKISRIKHIELLEIGNYKSETETFGLTLETVPGNAVFETTVAHSTVNEEWNIGPISRTNMYGTQSDCVDDVHIKLYCYCLISNPGT